MSAYNAEQWDTDGEMFDGSYEPLRTRRLPRRPMKNHGRQCSPNPEKSCVCGEDERESLSAEARELREARALGYTELPADMPADHPFWTRHHRSQRKAS